jgi:hypothetical protein
MSVEHLAAGSRKFERRTDREKRSDLADGAEPQAGSRDAKVPCVAGGVPRPGARFFNTLESRRCGNATTGGPHQFASTALKLRSGWGPETEQDFEP